MGRSKGQGNTKGISAKGHSYPCTSAQSSDWHGPPSAGPGFDGSTGWYEELGITHTLCRTRVTEVKPCGDH